MFLPRELRIKSAEVAVLRKKIKKFNVITGVLLAVITGAAFHSSLFLVILLSSCSALL